MTDKISYNAHRMYNKILKYLNYNLLPYRNEVIEYPESYMINVDLPHFRKDEIKLNAYENKLVIIATKINSDLNEVNSNLQTFEHTYNFNHPINLQNVYANFYKNQLEVYLPKLNQAHDISIEEDKTISSDSYYDEWRNENDKSDM